MNVASVYVVYVVIIYYYCFMLPPEILTFPFNLWVEKLANANVIGKIFSPVTQVNTAL